MDEFHELYRRIEYLRSRGVKMKEIADCAGMAPSVMSSLYTTVLPGYFEATKTMPSDEALDHAIALVNNVSKRRMLSSLSGILLALNEKEASEEENTDRIPFMDQLTEEIRLSVRKAKDISGLYMSYSLSSSSDALKMEPFIITLSESKEHIRVGRLNAYGQIQWGIGVSGDPQNFYCMFSETEAPQFTLVSLFLQIPLFRYPRQLRGMYIGLDYNRNPVARRIVLVRESEHADTERFLSMESGLLPKEELTPERQAYYDYTCQAGDYIKMCTVPSLQMDESDLTKEKKMLSL